MKKLLDSSENDEAKLKGMKALIFSLCDETAQLGAELKNSESIKQKVDADLNKVTKVKQKLEALCRELQVQNKGLIVSRQQVSADECQKRADLGKTFGDQLKDISVKMEAQDTERIRVHEENVDLRTKLKNFIEQVCEHAD